MVKFKASTAVIVSWRYGTGIVQFKHYMDVLEASSKQLRREDTPHHNLKLCSICQWL